MTRRVVKSAGWVVCLALVVVIWPVQVGGWASYTVVSGTSMEPIYHSGDMVVGWHRGSYDPGDIVVFTVPDGEPGAGYQVIHRLVSVDAGAWTTQGDNKTSVDPWSPTDEDIVGRAVMHIPNGGYALMWMPVLLALSAGILVMLALWPRSTRGRRRTGVPPEDWTSGNIGPNDGRGSADPYDMASTAVALIVGLTVGLAWPAASLIAGNAATLGGAYAGSISAWTLSGAQLELPVMVDSPPDVTAGEEPFDTPEVSQVTAREHTLAPGAAAQMAVPEPAD